MEVVNHKAAGLIKNQIESLKNGITLLQEADAEDKKQLERLVEVLETLREHMEFTSQIFDSNEDIASLKQKFKAIREAYDEVKSAEDINTVVLQYVLDYVNATFLKKVATRVDGFFVQDDEGKKSYVKKELNNGWIQILAFRAGLLVELYGKFALHSKANLFSQLKTSQDWQDLNKFVTFKRDLTPEEIHHDNKRLVGAIRLMYTIVKNRTEGVEKPDFSSKISLVREALSYKGQAEKLEVMSSLYMMNPNEHAFKVFHFNALPIMTKINSLKLPSIGCDQYIYVPRLFPRITKEVIQKEYENNTVNAYSKDLFETFEKPDLASQRDQAFKELFNSNEDKVGIRINSPEHLQVFGSTLGNASRKIRGLFSKAPSALDTEGVVIYIHGGGFASASTASYRPLTYRWANNLKMVQFSLEYRLAPANKYPDALDDVWQAYLWIINYAETILGIRTNKIIIAGDSAGGNLAIALTLRLIRAGLRAPDGCFLIYPCLEISKDLISPSFIHSIDDTILPAKLLTLFNNAYVPEDAQPSRDPFLSPGRACDDLLKQLPPVRLILGDLDPLHDQSWEFMRRLVKLNKDVQTLVYEGAIHGFYGFTDNLKYNELTKDGLVMLRELVHPRESEL